MPIDLAVMLAAIATKTLVAELIRGGSMSRESWADVGAQVVDAVVATSARPAPDVRPAPDARRVEPVRPVLDRLGQGLSEVDGRVRQLGHQVDRVSEEVRDVSRRVDRIQIREFDQHMAAGRRHLRDLPVEWRTAHERRALIRDARHEFVSAVASAELMRDPYRQALAETALAGCWLWVPSLPDVKHTIGHARQVLEQDVLYGSGDPAGAYDDVLKLCRAYGERPEHCTAELGKWKSRVPEARIAVLAYADMWVQCAGVDLKVLAPQVLKRNYKNDTISYVEFLHQLSQLIASTRMVSIKVRNTRAEWISVQPTEQAVIAEVASAAMPSSSDHPIAPGEKTTLTLTLPARVPTTLPAPTARLGTIGFMLP